MRDEKRDDHTEEWWSLRSDAALNPDPYSGQLVRCGLCGKRGTERWLEIHSHGDADDLRIPGLS